jgi:hypothetical protein
MPDEPEEGFTVRDRRRFSVEDTDSNTSAAASTAEVSTPNVENSAPSVEFVSEGASSASDSYGEGDYLADDAQDAGQLPDVYSVLALFMGELRNLAWLRMGLVANPGTGVIERDLPQAKVAIDTVSFLATQLEPLVAPEERLPLKALVSDLQVNFVEQSKRSQ